MAHTPGPWATVDAEWIMHRRTGMGFRYFPVRGTGQTWDIANVFADEDDPEMAANARLIAMAPELLDALKMIAKKQETGEGEFSVRDLCNELIAEAEGRE